MKILLKLEYVFLFLVGILAFIQTGTSLWWFAALFFLPDLSMIGYLAGNKSGAFLYNLSHHFGVGILCFVAGKYLDNDYLTISGIILFSHAAFDRILGYGLKFSDSFHNTHLGKIGK